MEDDPLADLKADIAEALREKQEQHQRKLVQRRLAEANYRAKLKTDPVLKAKQYATFKKYRAKPDVRKKLTDSSMRYIRNKRERLAGRPKPEMCEVCNRGGRIVFDHCHTNNKFRGWLCQDCNLILGHAFDDVGLLEKLIVYLKAHSDD